MEYTIYILKKHESDNIRIVFKRYNNSEGMTIDFGPIQLIHNYHVFGDNYVQKYTYEELKKYMSSLDYDEENFNDLINYNNISFHINFARNIYEFLVNELYYELVDTLILDDDIF